MYKGFECLRACKNSGIYDRQIENIHQQTKTRWKLQKSGYIHNTLRKMIDITKNYRFGGWFIKRWTTKRRYI